MHPVAALSCLLRFLVLAVVLGPGLSHMSGANSNPAPWVPDLGDGTFQNPVLFADYSDPDVVRVGDDFYLTASSFGDVPGLPILHSRDLVNWAILGYAVERLPERFDTVQHGNGIWAPSIRHHDGWFWIFVGDPDRGILMTKARDPRGPWTPLHVVQEGRGWIDPCPLWDDDGQAYLVHAWANSRAGKKDLLVVHRMKPDGTALLDEGTVVVDGRGGVHPTIEGPKFYKRNGWYYILAPAGGVRPGWQMAFRSKHPFGPYEAKRVLEQGTTNINGPHQGGWVELASGENWFVHFQDRGAYGRIVHVNPVHWVDDWPLMGADRDGNGVGEPVATHRKPDVGRTWPIAVPVAGDEFDGDTFNLAWQWHANPQPRWASLTERKGWLRLNAVPANAADARLWMQPNQLLQKLPAPRFTATTRMRLGPGSAATSAGLVMMGQNYAALLAHRRGGEIELRLVTCLDAFRGGAESTAATARLPDGDLWLRVAVAPEGVCTFGYSNDGTNFAPLGDSFTTREGRWIGAKVGLVCVGDAGFAEFDWMRIE